MNLNSFKFFSRNLAKQKTVGILSISSLAIAIAVVILIGLWSINEFSFDGFHKDKDKIHRLTSTCVINNEKTKMGSTYKPIGTQVMEQYPEISDMCRVRPSYTNVILKGVPHSDNQILMTDPNFFTFFTFLLKSGDPRTCLSFPDGIVIDESTARRYFPNENPIGKNLNLYNTECHITGIMYDMPENSHLQAQIITPFLGVYKGEETGDQGFITYLKINNPASFSKIEKGITEWLNNTNSIFKDIQFSFQLQSLEDIHFDNTIRFDSAIHGNKILVVIFLLTAFIILLIACINFINLFISTSFLRAKSIGVKKALGSEKGHLIKEFYIETFYYAIIAVGTGLVIASLALPLFNQLTDYRLVIDFTNPILYLLLLLITSIVMLTAGTFPALYMTRFSAVDTLKGQFKGKNLSFLQKGMIITQFTASITILISVFFIHKQVNYMLDKDLGFNKENIIYIYNEDNFIKNLNTFRKEMTNHPSITDVTFKDAVPTQWQQGYVVSKPGDNEQFLMELCFISPNYFEVMGMKMATGQPLDEESKNQQYCIINETAARMLGFSDPVGEKINADGEYVIKGVVKDAQTQSLHQKTDPQVYFNIAQSNSNNSIVLFKIMGDPQDAIRTIETKWKENNPNSPFKFKFLDDTYAQLYKSETNAGHILSAAMGITLIISVAGLFAMAYYTTQRRLKEVGVRKVNGASVSELLLILNRDFFIWVGISFLIACPVAYMLIRFWLENFTDHTAISWWVFVLVGGITFIVTAMTVSQQTWKAANINPVKVLKTE